MIKNHFSYILQNDEKILWANKVNKRAYIFSKAFGRIIICALISLFAAGMIGGPASAIIGSPLPEDNELQIFLSVAVTVWLVVFSLLFVGSMIHCILSANRAAFAITDKRVIKRSGVFRDHFAHYSLKNIGNVIVAGGFFDKNGENASASLSIVTRDFHGTANNARPAGMRIDCLCDGYDAYRLLSQLTEGYNDVLHIKTEE